MFFLHNAQDASKREVGGWGGGGRGKGGREYKHTAAKWLFNFLNVFFTKNHSSFLTAAAGIRSTVVTVL